MCLNIKKYSVIIYMENNKLKKLIEDLIIFFIKENYNKYLKDNKIKKINESELDRVINSIYEDKKSKCKTFLKSSLKEIMKDDYIGDLTIENIYIDITNNEIYCKNKIITEIKLYQQKNNKNINYDELLS